LSPPVHHSTTKKHTKSSKPLTHAKMKFTGKIPTRGWANWARTPKRRRATCRSIPAPRSGIESTALRSNHPHLCPLPSKGEDGNLNNPFSLESVFLHPSFTEIV